MAAIVFQTPLTHEESDFYSQKFRQLDSEELGVVTGEAVKPLFAASGLSSQILSQIWALVDIDNKGFLNQNEFNAAMRLIAQMQQFPGQSVTTTLYDHPPSRLPILSDLKMKSPILTIDVIVCGICVCKAVLLCVMVWFLELGI